MRTTALKLFIHFYNLKNFLIVLISTMVIFSCSSDDNGDTPQENAEEVEEILDFSLLVDSWEAQDFVLESSNSSLQDTNVTGQGGSVDLAVTSNGSFIFTMTVFPDTPEIMNSGEFRIEENTLQARFENEMSFRNLEAEISESNLVIEGRGLFDLSGEGSNISINFRGTFVRK